jgi:hypothetical protein
MDVRRAVAHWSVTQVSQHRPLPVRAGMARAIQEKISIRVLRTVAQRQLQYEKTVTT